MTNSAAFNFGVKVAQGAGAYSPATFKHVATPPARPQIRPQPRPAPPPPSSTNRPAQPRRGARPPRSTAGVPAKHFRDDQGNVRPMSPEYLKLLQRFN